MRLGEIRQRWVRQQNDKVTERESFDRRGAPIDQTPILSHAQVSGETAERVEMDLDRVVGEACEECDGKAKIDTRDDIDIDHTTKDAATRETCVGFMFHESGVGEGGGSVLVEKQLWNRRHGNGFNWAFAGFSVSWGGPSVVLEEPVNV